MAEFISLLPIIAIIISIASIVLVVATILAIFRIRDNTERTALMLEAFAEYHNIPLPKEYTKNFTKNHY